MNMCGNLWSKCSSITKLILMNTRPLDNFIHWCHIAKVYYPYIGLSYKKCTCVVNCLNFVVNRNIQNFLFISYGQCTRTIIYGSYTKFHM